ncbi:MAG: nitroreductase family protein [Flammeovirgaceae bacterium]|nr:nitroreductase family protein [Flammeovirgaceae bacterium]
MRKIKNIFFNILRALGLGYLVWLLKTYIKLRFKIRALYVGVQENQKSSSNMYNFRRNIHRLEKGLSYKDLKEVFAEDYIGETVEYLINGLDVFDKGSISWGKAVLNLYFKNVTPTKTIEKAFIKFSNLDQNYDKSLVPYPSNLRVKSEVSYDDLMGLSLKRRSVRYYKDLKVEEEVIKKAYEIAKLAPSACNRQSFNFYFYNEANEVKELSSIPGGVQGYTLPSIIVVVGNYSGYFDERDINAPIIDSSLATMSFIYALETLGLSSVCINWPNLPDREQKVRTKLDLASHEFVVMMIGVGYPIPDGKIPYSAKRSAEEVIHVNKKIRYRSNQN